jgi:uncharacterized membrane protein
MGFSIGSALRFGWETFKTRPWLFIGAMLILAAASAGVEALTRAIDATLTGATDGPSLLGFIVNLALGTIIGMGATAFFLAAHDNADTVALSSLWHPQPFWKYLGTSILVSLAIGVGLVLLIVPGIILGLMFMFTPFLVIERELGPIEAMKESHRITRGHKWNLLGLLLMTLLVNLLGALAFIVGLLVTIPVTVIAVTHAYRVLSGSAETRPVDATLAA